MDERENKQSPEHELDPTWSTFTLARRRGDDKPITEKVSTIQFNETEALTGASLKRHAEYQTDNIYPPVADVEMVDALIADPRASGVYAYFRVRPGSADCYHIVINGEEVTANVAQTMPLDDVDITVPKGGTLSVAIRARTGLGESDGPECIVDEELLKLFDACRNTVETVVPEIMGPKHKITDFAAAAIRRVLRRR